MRRVSGCLFVLAALFTSVAVAADPKVYKWTDENGTVHFSAEPPAAGAEEVPLDKAPAPPPAAPVDAAAPAPTADENTKRCEDHRYNLKLLENLGQPIAIDDAGTMRALDATERAKQIDIARVALKECEVAAAAALRAPTPPAR